MYTGILKKVAPHPGSSKKTIFSIKRKNGLTVTMTLDYPAGLGSVLSPSVPVIFDPLTKVIRNVR